MYRLDGDVIGDYISYYPSGRIDIRYAYLMSIKVVISKVYGEQHTEKRYWDNEQNTLATCQT